MGSHERSSCSPTRYDGAISPLAKYGLGIGAVAAVSAAATWLAGGSLQQDFAAYWVAGGARRLGLDPYVNHVGGAAAPSLWDGVAVFAHSRFLYPPLVAELFRPLAALPYAVAKALFTALLVASWIGAALLAAPALEAPARRAPLVLAAGALYFPLYLNLERGQIDLPVLVLLLLTWRARERPAAAGCALAAAATLKPALAGLLPIVIALGRGRLLLAVALWGAAGVLVTAAISGPSLLREYATVVLPRAALYGEGGTEAMLLPAERLPATVGGAVTIDDHRYAQSLWEGPVSASLPRLLSPEAPSRLASALPYLIALAGLIAASRRLRRAGAPDRDQGLLLLAGAVACVVASPSGWAMGLVWALPAVAAGAASRLEGRARLLALTACACPPLFSAWPALAGAAFVAAIAIGALRGPA